MPQRAGFRPAVDQCCFRRIDTNDKDSSGHGDFVSDLSRAIVACQCTGPNQRQVLCFRQSANRSESAVIVSVGLANPEVGNTDAPVTYRLSVP